MKTLKGNIRRAEEQDFGPILSLARHVAAAGDAFPWEGFGSDTKEGKQREVDLLAEIWLPDAGQQRAAFVCEVEDFDGVAGVYVLQPNGVGRCSHIAQGAYMVDPSLRSRGLGKQLCAHSLQEAQKQNFRGMQFDMVVATNTAAIKAWISCGFKIMCTLPRVFHHPEDGLVDVHIMFHDFSCMEALGQNHDSGALEKLKPSFSYPTSASNYTVGTEVSLALEPILSAESSLAGNSHFRVQPPLPEGLFLDPRTGAVQGTPARPCPETTYRIIAETHGEVTFQVDPESIGRPSMAVVYINEAFAAQVENVVDVADMPREPARTRTFGDWMIWMVHRAWLNDPTLIEFSFNSMHMPLPHLESRIAPKLMEAMKSNTYIEVLSLSNANVQKSTATELAEALGQNCTLRTLNLEANCLDSSSIREIALAIKCSPHTQLEHLRLQHQRQMGPVFGRPAEEAVGLMMQKNETLVKLGFECQDAHWRNSIDRALVRNNDFYRRRQQAASAPASADELEAPVQETTLGQLALQESPGPHVKDFFSDDSPAHGLLRAYLAQNLQLPTPSQLQHYAKNIGMAMSYTTAGPLIRQCRSWLLDNAIASEVLAVDAFGMNSVGTLRTWQEINDRWIVVLCVEDGVRLTCKSDRDPSIFLSESWAPWLNKTKPECGGA